MVRWLKAEKQLVAALAVLFGQLTWELQGKGASEPLRQRLGATDFKGVERDFKGILKDFNGNSWKNKGKIGKKSLRRQGTRAPQT